MAQLDVQRASQMQMVATAKLEADISNISGSVSQDLASAVKSVVFSTKDHLDVNNSIKVLDKLTEYSLTDGTSIETSMAIDKLKSMIIDTVDLHAMDNVLTIEQQERLDNEIQNMRALTKLNEYVDHLHGVRQASMVSKKLAIIYPKLEQLRAGTNLKEIIDNTFLDQISLSRRAGAGESCGMKVAKSLEVMVGCAQTTKNYQSVELDEYPEVTEDREWILIDPEDITGLNRISPNTVVIDLDEEDDPIMDNREVNDLLEIGGHKSMTFKSAPIRDQGLESIRAHQVDVTNKDNIKVKNDPKKNKT